VADAFMPPVRGKDYSVLDVAHAFLISALCYTWCRAESLARGVIPPGRSALWAGCFRCWAFRSISFAPARGDARWCPRCGAVGFLAMGLVLAAVGTLLTELVRS
jgi:hypothetical protein